MYWLSSAVAYAIYIVFCYLYWSFTRMCFLRLIPMKCFVARLFYIWFWLVAVAIINIYIQLLMFTIDRPVLIPTTIFIAISPFRKIPIVFGLTWLNNNWSISSVNLTKNIFSSLIIKIHTLYFSNSRPAFFFLAIRIFRIFPLISTPFSVLLEYIFFFFFFFFFLIQLRAHIQTG